MAGLCLLIYDYFLTVCVYSSRSPPILTIRVAPIILKTPLAGFDSIRFRSCSGLTPCKNREREVFFVWKTRPWVSWSKCLFFLVGFPTTALVAPKFNTSLQNRYYPLINTILRWWVMSYPWTSTQVSSPSRNGSHASFSIMIDVDASLQEYVVLHLLFSTNYGSSKAHQADWTPSPTSNRCQPLLSLTAYGAIVSITHYTFLLCVHFVSDQFCLCTRSV